MTTSDKPLSDPGFSQADAEMNPKPTLTELAVMMCRDTQKPWRYPSREELDEFINKEHAALEGQLAKARKQFSDHHRAEVDHRKMIEGQLADWKERAEKAERQLAKAESLYQMAVRGRKDIREAFKREREEAKSLRSRLAALEPVSVKDRLPTKEDADEHGEVLWRRPEPRGGYGWGAESWDKLPVFKTKKVGTDGKMYYSEFHPPNETDATHWMQCPRINTPPEDDNE